MKPRGFSTFTGSLGGAQGIYEYEPSNSIYAAASLNWRQGNTSQAKENRFILDIDVQERVGYTVKPDCFDLKMSFFAGFGFRLIHHHLTQPQLDSMKFKYQEFYVPLGIVNTFCLNQWFEIGINAIWMPQVFPTVVIKPDGQTSWRIKKTLANTQVEMPIIFKHPCWSHFSCTIKPFFQYWEDGKTIASTGGVPLGIPKNTSHFAGTELNLGWTF